MLYRTPSMRHAQTVCLRDTRNLRRTVRTVDPQQTVSDAVTQAAVSGEIAVVADHGGGVPNAYRYPAVSQYAVAIALPSGDCCYWAGEIPANKITYGGCMADAHPALRPIGDHRYSQAAEDEARTFAAGLLQGALAGGKVVA